MSETNSDNVLPPGMPQDTGDDSLMAAYGERLTKVPDFPAPTRMQEHAEGAKDDPEPENTTADETSEEATDEGREVADNDAGSSEDVGGGEEDGDGDEGATDEGSDDAEGSAASDDGDGDSGDGTDEGGTEEEQPARRVRPDKRTRAAMRFNEERAERASVEREQARAEAERWKARFEALSKDSVEGEDALKSAEKEEAEFAEKAKEAQPSAHTPSQSDVDYLAVRARERAEELHAEDPEGEGRRYAESVAKAEPKLVTAARDLDDPMFVINEMSAFQQSSPEEYRTLMDGSPQVVFMRLKAFEERAAELRAEEARAEGKAKAERRAKAKDAKPKRKGGSPDKPLSSKTTPKKSADPDADVLYTDQNGVKWRDDPDASQFAVIG